MNEYVVFNKKYEMVFKTESLAELHEYLLKLYREKFCQEYANKPLSFFDLEQLAKEYNAYLDLECWGFTEDISDLRHYFNDLGLIVAF